jgi:hypothetical protein
MSNIIPVWAGLPDSGSGDGWVIQWAAMQNGDVGVPVSATDHISGHADRSVQVEGTFGAGGDVVIEGSNDTLNFEVLNDPSSTPLSFTAPKIKGVLEAVRQIRPHVTGGDGTTSITVSLMMRRLR